MITSVKIQKYSTQPNFLQQKQKYKQHNKDIYFANTEHSSRKAASHSAPSSRWYNRGLYLLFFFFGTLIPSHKPLTTPPLNPATTEKVASLPLDTIPTNHIKVQGLLKKIIVEEGINSPLTTTSTNQNETPIETKEITSLKDKFNTNSEFFNWCIPQFLTLEDVGSVYQLSLKSGIPVANIEEMNKIKSNDIEENTQLFFPYIGFKVPPYRDSRGKITGGGNLLAIAKSLGTSPKVIAEASNIEPSAALKEGQILTVPGKLVPTGTPGENLELTQLLHEKYPQLEERCLTYVFGDSTLSSTNKRPKVNLPPSSTIESEGSSPAQYRLFKLDPRIQKGTDNAKKKPLN